MWFVVLILVITALVVFRQTVRTNIDTINTVSKVVNGEVKYNIAVRVNDLSKRASELGEVADIDAVIRKLEGKVN